MKAMKHAAEALFSVFERLVTAALYPLCLLRERLSPRVRVPIFMYHQVAPPAGGRSVRDRVSPDRFERQARAILDAGFRVISLSDLVRRRSGPEARADLGRCAVLTFDDGYRGQFAFAYPVLRRHGLPATFFVTTGYVGRNATFAHLAPAAVTGGPARGLSPAWLPLSWDEVREMAAHDIAIESHSVTHRSLGRLEEGEMEFEIRGSKGVLEHRLGRPVRLFAYPFGSGAYGDFHAGLRGALERAGYDAACTTVVGRAGVGSDPFALPRIPIEEADGPFRVRCKLVGAYDWVGIVKTAWQRLSSREEIVDAPLPVRAGPGVG